MLWRKLTLALSIGLNLIFLYSLIWGNQGIADYRRLKNECRLLQEQIDALDKANVALEKEIALLETDRKYQEKIIRTRLNFVKPNEILYVFSPSASEPAGAEQDEPEN